MEKKYRMAKGFRSFFPRFCMLDAKTKSSLFDNRRERIIRELQPLTHRQRNKIFSAVSEAKPNAIEFLRKNICNKCIHKDCRIKKDSQKNPSVEPNNSDGTLEWNSANLTSVIPNKPKVRIRERDVFVGRKPRRRKET